MKEYIKLDLLLLLLALFAAAVIGGHFSFMAQPGAGFGNALLGGSESPLTTRLILGLLICGGLAYNLLSNRAVTIPRQSVGLMLPLAVLIIGFAVAGSEFKVASFDAWLHWVVYACVFFLAVACVGRRHGPKMALTAIVIGAALISLIGIRDYLEIFRVEPTYRIFSRWHQPNALAGLLCAALPLSLALIVQVARKQEKLLYGVGAVLIAFGLVLTQSKGGYLAAGVGVLGMLGAMTAWKGGKKVLTALVPLAVAALMGFALTKAPAGEGAGALARVGGQAAEATQSQAFRINLWKSAAELVQKKPLGWGPGTFGEESARPGLVMPTETAHQAYLQLAFEGGIISLLLVLGMAVFWVIEIFRGARKLSTDQNVLRAGTFGCLLAVGAHGLVESSFAYIGIGIILFAVLGIGLNLSTDGSRPELMPKGFRFGLVLLLCAIPLLLLSLSSSSEMARSNLITAVVNSDQAALETSLKQAESSRDGELIYLSSRYTRDPARQKTALLRAVTNAPSIKHHRALAAVHAAEGQPGQTVSVLEQGLVRDPNNLAALEMLYLAQEELGDQEKAIETARRLVAVEQTPYFQVRALAEFVPVQTFKARLWLASLGLDRTENLSKAVEGLLDFRRTTVPQVILYASQDLAYSGIDRDEAVEILNQGLSAAELLISTEGADPSLGSAAVNEFSDALAELSPSDD